MRALSAGKAALLLGDATPGPWRVEVEARVVIVQEHLACESLNAPVPSYPSGSLETNRYAVYHLSNGIKHSVRPSKPASINSPCNSRTKRPTQKYYTAFAKMVHGVNVTCPAAPRQGQDRSAHSQPSPSRFARLHLLRAPPRVRIPHVRGRLDGRDIFEGGVSNAHEAHDGSRNPLSPVASDEDASNEDVDCNN